MPKRGLANQGKGNSRVELRAGESCLVLEILGYEFPDLTARNDANWLIVRIQANSGGRTWEAQGPYLRTCEVAYLADWLEHECAEHTASECGFMEPDLEFHMVRGPSGAPFLRVYFELELRPDWTPGMSAGKRDCWVEFPIAELDLPRAAQSLREQLAAFPERK